MTDSLDRLQAAIGADFQIEGELGSGAMRTVYRVYDRKRGETIALKTLHRVDASAIYRFKQEFRALADVSHGNGDAVGQSPVDQRTRGRRVHGRPEEGIGESMSQGEAKKIAFRLRKQGQGGWLYFIED